MTILNMEASIIEMEHMLRAPTARRFVRWMAAQNLSNANVLWMTPNTAEALRQSIADPQEEAHIKFYSVQALRRLLNGRPGRKVLNNEPTGIALLTDAIAQTLQEAAKSAENGSALGNEINETLGMIAYRKASPVGRIAIRVKNTPLWRFGRSEASPI